MSVLDPDIGMDTEIFAQQRKGSLSGRLSEMSGYNGEPVNVDEAFDKVTENLEKYFFKDKKYLMIMSFITCVKSEKDIFFKLKKYFLISRGKTFSTNIFNKESNMFSSR